MPEGRQIPGRTQVCKPTIKMSSQEDRPIIHIQAAVKVNDISLEPHPHPDARSILPELGLLFDSIDDARVGDPHAKQVARSMIGDGHTPSGHDPWRPAPCRHRPTTVTIAGVGMIISPLAQRQPYSPISRYNRLGYPGNQLNRPHGGVRQGSRKPRAHPK